MTLYDISKMFNRALSHSFEKKKFIFLFLMLCIAGVFVLFFRSLALFADGWWKTSLDFFPLFIALGFVLAAEVILVRLYVRQQEGEKPEIISILMESWELMLRISYLAMPFLLLYLLFWILSGLFLLLKAIPIFGTVLAVIFSFAPFIFNLGSILLVVAALFLCFYVCPHLALDKQISRRTLFQKLKAEPFFILFFFLIDLVPVWIVFKILTFAATLTFVIESLEVGSLEKVLQSFFIMIPFLAILTPMINFFFNFALESALWLAAGRESQDEYI